MTRGLTSLLILALAGFPAAGFADLDEDDLVEIYSPANDVRSFGFAVAIDGDTMLVGAPRSVENGEMAGAVYVYVKDNQDSWTEQAKLLPPDGGWRYRFGSAVALDGDTALIGAPGDDEVDVQSGSAFIFVRSGTTWTFEDKLVPSGGHWDDIAGTAVAVAGDVALVGVPGDDEQFGASGSVYVFHRSGVTWTEQSKFGASDPSFAAWFGHSIAMDGNTVVVGAWGEETFGGASGAAYIFTSDGANNWTQQDKLLASDGRGSELFGWSVSIDGDSVLIGTRQSHYEADDEIAAYLFTRNGSDWQQESKLVAKEADDSDSRGQGESVALRGQTAVIGGRTRENGNGGLRGTAMIFSRNGPVWYQGTTLTSPVDPTYDGMGYSLAIVDDALSIGAPGVDHAGNFSAGSLFLLFVDSDEDGSGDNVDTDDDNDGILDAADNCVLTSNVGQLDNDGDFFGDACDLDDDNDDVLDQFDVFPFDESEWSDADNDGTGDNADPDDDNDGVTDDQDDFPFDPSESTDTDGDGLGDNADLDDNADGLCDNIPWFPLKENSVWTYRGNDGGSYTQTLQSATKWINGVDTLGWEDDAGFVSYFSSDCDGLRMHQLLDPNVVVIGLGVRNGWFTFQPSIFLDNVQPRPEADTSYFSSGFVDIEVQDVGIVGSLSYEAMTTVEAYETLTVPFGQFDAVRVRLSLRLFGDIGSGFQDETEVDTYWLAEHYGMIKYKQEFAGLTATYELTGISLDFDGDGLNITEDNCPTNADPDQTDWDNDGLGDVCDNDDDDDGVPDVLDAYPYDPSESADTDGDGIPDNADAFPNDPNETTDTDGDGIGDNSDPDIDGDGVLNVDDDYPFGRFDDARPGYWAFTFIETLARAGITSGCGNDNYCPEAPVTRAQMAVFIERGMNGSGYSPPAATGGVFFDVGALDFAASYIEQLSADGITAGCGSGNYCPDADVTRDQMAVFLLRAKYGSNFSPPAPVGVFADVPANYWAAAWIEKLAADGITAGCGGGNYCPEAQVTRDQMAVFLVRTFNL